MLNLRFKYIVITSLFFVLHNIPKANKMIRYWDRYTDEEREKMACKIIDHMKRRGRTVTDLYGMKNIQPLANRTVQEDGTVVSDRPGAVYFANHQGKYDAIGVMLALEKPCPTLWDIHSASRLVGKQVSGLLDCSIVDLRDMKDKVRAIQATVEKVKQGRDFLIFPEGGYTDNHNELQEFHSGCFAVSLKTKAPIVPTVLYDAYKSMNSNTFEKVVTQIHFLDPIYYDEYKDMRKVEICELVKSRIEARLKDIKNGVDLGAPDKRI